MSVLRDFEDYGWRNVVPQDLLTIYAPYRRERKIPPHAALLILHPVTTALAVQPHWTDAAERLLARARARSMPILHSVPPGCAPISKLDPRNSEPVIQRPCDSAFLFSELPAVLKRSGIGGLVLCGGTTSGAVRATAVEAKSYGYKVAIAEETTADEAPLLHMVALFDIAHKYGDVMSIDEMLAMIERPETL